MWDLLFENKLDNIIPGERIFRDEPMYKHTTFRVGGPARAYVAVGDLAELKAVLFLCKENDVNYYIIGNGSNLLVSDEGYDGVIIEIGSGMREISLEGSQQRDNAVRATDLNSVEGEQQADVDSAEGGQQADVDSDRVLVHSTAGVLLSALAAFALKNGLTGLEFAAGIPGTVGGAMVMNAGAYGGEMKDVVKRVHVLDPETGEDMWITAADMDFAYRHSIVREKGYIVLAAEFVLTRGDEADIKAVMDDLAARRREKQPLEYPSAGSTFKRPEGYFAGKLIEDSNLKGYAVGNAEVSTKHAGFVVNKGDATATEVYTLICDVRKKVKADTGVTLEPEVIMLGEF